MWLVSKSAELAASLRRILDAIERGDLDASSAHGRALKRRIEGAVVALEELGTGPARSRAAGPRPAAKGRK